MAKYSLMGDFYMKYCPYCGSTLQDSAASYCSECGQKLFHDPKTDDPKHKKRRFSSMFCAKRRTQTPDPAATNSGAEIPEDDLMPKENEDRGYDGYYDDILPNDLGKKRDPVDRSLVMKIVLLGAAVIAIISACVVALYLL